MSAEPAPLDDREPIAWLRAYVDGGEPRVLPLFRRPARVTVGGGRGCDWRFDGAELADRELTLAWDGVRLRAEDAARPEARTTVRNGQSIVSGRLRIALDVVLHDEEVTVIRKVELPPDETTAPIPLVSAPGAPPLDDDDERTVITVLPPVAPPPTGEPSPPREPPPPRQPEPPARMYLPPRNRAGAEEPTGEWSLEDALRPTADLLDRLGKRGLRTLARRTPPRRLALGAALVLVVAVELFMLLRPRRPAPQPRVQASSAAEHPGSATPRASVMLPDKDVEVTMHRAIAAYRAGNVAEALAAFSKLEEETHDPAARTMLFVLRSRGAGAP